MKKDTNLLDTQDVRAEAATALTPNATNGEKIKALRTAQGMSMAELSRRASMSDRAIRYIEAGEREPSVDAIQKIAAALGVTTDYFMDDATFQKELSDDQFYADVRKKYGSRGVAQAKKIKEQTSALFAGGGLPARPRPPARRGVDAARGRQLPVPDRAALCAAPAGCGFRPADSAALLL